MKKSPIDKIPFSLPKEILAISEGAKIYDSSSSPEARVYYLDKGDGFYLKISQKGSLAKEAEMNTYYHKKGLGPEVLEYLSCDKDYLLTKRVIGEDATHEKFLSSPTRLCDFSATTLRVLHELDFCDCPVKNKNESYIALVKSNYKKGLFDLKFAEPQYSFSSADEAYSLALEAEKLLCADALLHGDYCLPNIMLREDFSLSGFIDLGNGGIGDRHIDIFWGVWTLYFNLKTNKYKDRFLDAYGRDRINEDMLALIAACEVFG